MGAVSLTGSLDRVAVVPQSRPLRYNEAVNETGNDTEPARNVLGTKLEPCGTDPVTGFYRDGCCQTGPQDLGTHTVCAIVTDAFLVFTAERGNDLSTPMPQYNFPGLKAGDRWCLCASRWEEARRAGVAPPVVLQATHRKTLDAVSLAALQAHATNPDADLA